MPVACESRDGKNVIRLEGAVDIGSAAEFRQLLIDVLNQGDAIEISLRGATELDITAMQLLWAAGKAARGAGTGFALDGEVPPEIRVAFMGMGLEPSAIFEEVANAFGG